MESPFPPRKKKSVPFMKDKLGFFNYGKGVSGK